MTHDASGKLTGLKLKDGKEVQANTVVAGIGAKCSTELFKDKLEMAEKGIKVDSRCVRPLATAARWGVSSRDDSG